MLFFFRLVKGNEQNFVSFFGGLLGDKPAMLLVYAVEGIYQLQNLNFIGPVAFAKSLLAYSKTGVSGILAQKCI